MKSDFRKLDEHEVETVKTVWMRRKQMCKQKLSKDARIKFVLDGNYTVAILRNGKTMHVGVSKRDPRDDWKAELGRDLALYRAARNAPLAE